MTHTIFSTIMHWVTNFAACSPGAGGISDKIIPPWYKYLGNTNDATGRCVPQFTVSGADISAILLAIVEMLLRLGAIVAVFFVVWGGVQYVLSQGASDKTKEAKDTIVNAIIGLVLVMLATVLVNFVGNTLL